MPSDPFPPPVHQLALPLDDMTHRPPPTSERSLHPAEVWAQLTVRTQLQLRARWLCILQEVIDHADQS